MSAAAQSHKTCAQATVYSTPLASPSNGHYYINSTCERLTLQAAL